ncbi:MAG: DUF58 domain-containing protein [Actinomycetota bacterium]|nr:DUF58 domain-containing protein [Actinomycetota bacterium]
MAPTGRTAAALAAIALAALLFPTWLVGAAALVLLAAAGADGWAVRAPPELERWCSKILSRGVPSPLRASASAGDGRRMILRQPGAPGLDVQVSLADGELRGYVVPARRGRYVLAPVACASIGPLGLVRVHHPPGAALPLAVYPDMVAAGALIARLRRQLAGRAGGIARGPLGLGTDFELIREYSPDDDVRQLNWRATARAGRPMSNQYRVERDRDVVCLLDAGRLTAAPIGDRTVLDASLDATVLVALAADELGDRCGAIAFDEQVRRYVSPRHLGARHLVEALFDLVPAAVDSDFELAFGRVGEARRGIVVVFTDLVDDAAARSLLAAIPMLVRRHAVIVASPVDARLQEYIRAESSSSEAVAAALVALDMVRTRASAAHALRRAGATVIEAGAGTLAEHCLDAYLRVKRRPL